MIHTSSSKGFRRSRLLEKIRSGKTVRVCSTGSSLTYFPAMAAHFGYDAVWVDTEHRAWDPREIREMILRHHLADIDCIFRPATTERASLSRYLEDGASALMIPMVNSAFQARALVDATKFPPLGDRGLDGSALDAGFWTGKPPDYPVQANRETALIVQIETPTALANLTEIASVEGVDLLFLGPADLSLRLGCAPSVAEKPFREALEHLAKVCQTCNMPWGLPAGTIEDARIYREMGACLINFGSEFLGVMKELEIASTKLNDLLNDE